MHANLEHQRHLGAIEGKGQDKNLSETPLLSYMSVNRRAFELCWHAVLVVNAVIFKINPRGHCKCSKRV